MQPPASTVETATLCARDFAIMLGVSERTLARRRALGEILDPLPGSGHPRWLKAEIEEWLAARTPRADEWRRRKRR